MDIMSEYINMLSGYKDRVARIALFDVFYQLENKQQKDDDHKPIDFFGIGLLGILFFFENMLMRNKKTGIRELAMFLEHMTNKDIQLSDEGYYSLAKQLVEVFRPSSGKRNSRKFYNYETREDDVIEYAILKAEHWDVENNIQYYTLAEEGLELVFATKEYFSEFQISISQMILRKQLEKGEFSSALRQVDEMRISVNTIKDKIASIKHEIQRNIISDDTYERYKEVIEDINRRLQQEHDEFSELMTFIKTTRSHFDHQHKISEKDFKALELIVRIDNELAHVHYLHTSLLNESIELKTTAVEAALESLYYTGVTSFNFDQEVARKMLSAPLPFEEGKVLAAPFLGTKKFETWSLLTVFEPQAIESMERLVNHSFLEVDEETVPSDRHITQKINEYLLDEMLKVVGTSRCFTLKEVFDKTKQSIFGTREFGDLWMIMHQLSPINIKEMMSLDEHVLSTAFKKKFSQYDYVEVVESEGEVTYNGNYTMKNMVLTLGGEGLNE